MELRRGKTFIKSSVQISHEKLIDSPAKEDPDTWSQSLGEQQRTYGEKSSQTSPCAQGYGRCPTKEVLSDPEGGPVPLCGTTFKLVRKSKTHDSVPGAVKAAAPTGQMVGSSSFPENPGSQRMIDYRHFVPQMPFVPAVAKSIPRKRISLKRSKKCFRNLFHMRRSKTENLAALSAKGKNLSPPGVPAQQGKPFLSMGEGLGLDSLCQDLSDSEFLHDSPFDLCSALCEDVASLKSFDSLTGCGEIFADGSSVPSVELKDGPESPAHSPQALDSKTPCGPSQGSTEQLMSPAQNEASDFTKFWDSVNRSVQQQQRRALMGPWLMSPQGTDTEQPRLDTSGLAELPLFPCRGPPSGSKASSIDTGTPKSEQPESVSTSDEGYYDSFSPGLEEEKKEAASPGTPAASFPRDSYSGDALYELFYDPSEAPVGPILDDDCVSESLSGPALGTPLSMCSFRVGADENLAPAPGPDLLSQGFLQSTWKGKECLLKLCDTELAITMGIVNWLRRTPPATAPTTASTPAPTPALVLREPAVTPDAHRVFRGAPVGMKGREDQALEKGKAVACLAPSRQEPWAHSGTKDWLVREREAPGEPARGINTSPKDGSLEEGTQDFSEGQFSSEATMTSISRNSKVVNSTTCLSSPKELGTPGNLRCSQGPLRPGPGGSALDPGPMLVGCVTHVAALQIYPDSHSPRQDKGNGLFWKPQAWGPNTVQKKPTSSKPNEAAACGLSSASPQDQRCHDLFLDLKQLKLEPSRLGTQVCSSVDSQPQQLRPRATEQVPQRGSVGS